MRAKLALTVEPVATAREAVRGADILATCTDSMHPVVEGSWIEPGMHVVNIGASDLGPEALARMEVVVRQGVETLPMAEDEVYRKGVGHSRGAFVGGSPEEQKRLPVSSSKGGAARPPAPLYAEVIAGKAAHRPHQISQYRPVESPAVLLDRALLYRRAKQQRLGRVLPTVVLRHQELETADTIVSIFDSSCPASCRASTS